MSCLLDTSLIVRYLTNDPPPLAAAAARLLEAPDGRFLVPAVVIAETYYVLTAVYGVPRAAALDALSALLSQPSVAPLDLDPDLALAALDRCRPSNRVSVVDALTWAAARSSGVACVHTFDRRFPREGITLQHPTLD